jgi:ubiquinone/menaquinone biosynthesis C-methylase UbiE
MTHNKTRNELLNIVPKNCKFLELGVFRGEFAKEILQAVNPSELYLVDIWSGEMGSGDKDGDNYVKVNDMRSVYLGLFHQVKNKSNIYLVRCESVPFLQSCKENYFDAVYVDADHSEEAVYNDMVNSLRVIKPGGLLMGHDYHHQIKTAVDRFCIDYKQRIVDVTDDGCPSFVIKVEK